MVLEVAILDIRAGERAEFEDAFREATPLIATSPGFLGLELRKCIEEVDRYLLLVRWEALEDHVDGFRRSDRYQEWRSLLHRFYDPFPTVEHYRSVIEVGPGE